MRGKTLVDHIAVQATDDQMREIAERAGLYTCLCAVCRHRLNAFCRDPESPGPDGGRWVCIPCGGSITRDERAL